MLDFASGRLIPA